MTPFRPLRFYRRQMMLQVALLALLFGVAGAEGAGSPSTTPGAVSDWLDRAAADVRAAADAPGDKPSMPSALDLAIMLVQARGNDADRALLRDLVNRPRPPLPPRADPIAAEFYWKTNSAIAFAVLGEIEPARERVREAEKVANSGEARSDFLGAVVPASLSMAWAAVGDVAAAEAVQVKDPPLGDRVTAYVWLARHFNDFGRMEARDQMLLKATQLAIERDDQTERAIGLEEVAKEMIEQGRLKEADAVIDGMPLAYPRCDAYGALARAHDFAGDAKATSSALRAALETLDAMGEEGGPSYAAVADDAAECGQAEIVRRAVAASEKHLRTAPANKRAWTLPVLARSLAAIDDREGVRRLVAEARTANAAVDDLEFRANVILDIAATFARLREIDRAVQEIQAAKEIHRETDYSVSTNFSNVLIALIRAGQSEKATELAEQHGFEPQDLDWWREESIRTFLRSQRFEDGRRQAMEIVNPRRRVRALRVVALAQARAGREEDAMKWIAALPSPHDRAVVHLGLAQQALGLEGRGMTRMLRF